MALSGTEILQVLPIQTNGQPTSVPLQTTTGAISALAAATLTLNPTAGIVAGTTRTQGGATAVTLGVNRVDTSTAPSAGSLVGDGIRLPAATAGGLCVIVNNTLNPIMVYGSGSDTVNGIAAATGIAVPPNSLDAYYAASTGQWQVEAGVGYAGQLNTVLALNSITSAGTNQGNALLLTADFNRLTTVGAGSGVKLPASQPGLDVFVQNHGANPVQVYGSGTDTIDDVATATGVSQMVNSVVLYTCYASGAWYSEGLATGYAGSGLQTIQFSDALTAAGTTQATGLQLTGMVNTVTTVASGTGVNLPASFAGLLIDVTNAGANNLLVYPFQGSSDTINGVAAATGIILQPNSIATFFCTASGAWRVLAETPISIVYNVNAATASTTLTAANVTGAQSEVDLALTGTLAAGGVATLPTVAQLVAALHCPTVGASYKLRVLNESGANFAWTVTTNTGWTLNGTMTVAQNTWRDFVLTVTSLTTATLQNIGTGTFS